MSSGPLSESGERRLPTLLPYPFRLHTTNAITAMTNRYFNKASSLITNRRTASRANLHATFHQATLAEDAARNHADARHHDKILAPGKSFLRGSLSGILERMKIYFAGPDIFRADVEQWAEAVRAACARHGHEALIPLDHRHVTATDIFRANLELLEAADALVCNLNPFRGTEPDSGTCVEVGYALARGKRVVGYLDDDTPLRERLAQAGHAALTHDGTRLRDGSGYAVEDFGYPVNLMLAVPLALVRGDVEAGIAAIRHGVETRTA